MKIQEILSENTPNTGAVLQLRNKFFELDNASDKQSIERIENEIIQIMLQVFSPRTTAGTAYYRYLQVLDSGTEKTAKPNSNPAAGLAIEISPNTLSYLNNAPGDTAGPDNPESMERDSIDFANAQLQQIVANAADPRIKNTNSFLWAIFLKKPKSAVAKSPKAGDSSTAASSDTGTVDLKTALGNWTPSQTAQDNIALIQKQLAAAKSDQGSDSNTSKNATVSTSSKAVPVSVTQVKPDLQTDPSKSLPDNLALLGKQLAAAKGNTVSDTNNTGNTSPGASSLSNLSVSGSKTSSLSEPIVPGPAYLAYKAGKNPDGTPYKQKLVNPEYWNTPIKGANSKPLGPPKTTWDLNKSVDANMRAMYPDHDWDSD